MKLADKGHFAPPPRLPRWAEQLSQTLANQPGVEARTHWLLGDETQVDGADFYLGQEELGHLHLDGEAHVAQPGPLRDALVKAGLASPFQWSRQFVTLPISDAAGVERGAWLFSLRRRQLEGVPVAELLLEVSEQAS
jgi:hypothetical protein